MLQLLIQILMNGLMMGLVYIMMALGFTLIFGIMRIVNFAHGEFYMLGAMAVMLLFSTLGINYFVAVLVAALMVAVVGMLIERLLLRQFVGRELNGMIMTLAIAITLKAGATIIFGPQEMSIPRPVSGVTNIAGILIPNDRMLVGAIAIAILVLFYFFLRYARAGLAMRAVAQDWEAAALQGIRPQRIYLLSFGIGCALAGLAGALMAPIYTVSPFIGEVPMLKAFIVVILGGLGSLPGAVVGGLLLGVVEAGVATFINTTVATMISFALVVVILLFRPAGLMGQSR
ncbi:branched-chain amino acid transport system permease protein [Roseovarius sp. MBR-51]